MSVRSTSLADTIVACATPAGSGAVAIVRLSGSGAVEIGRRIATSKAPRNPNELRRVRITDFDGALVDDAMAVEMHAPRSYTGEDVVEFHVHGAPAVVSRVLGSCIEAGARHAQPGEYTLRAFLNGRMDLAQAEAVGDLVQARSEEQRQVALGQLGGGLSREVAGLLEPLEGAVAAWRAALDFPEHASGDGFVPAHDSALLTARRRLGELLESARLDLQRSRQVVLAGAPNVGKSSLLNSWVGSRRVLVDDTPGTTRDPIEVELTSGLLRWSVWDTAGVRSEAVGLERAGIELSQERMNSADLVLWLVNPDEPTWPDAEVGSRVWVVGSKADLASESRRNSVEQQAQSLGLRFWGWVSVKSGDGVLSLRDDAAKSLEAVVPSGVSVVVRERHATLLREALAALARLEEARANKLTLDVWTLELEDVCRALGQILGRDVDAEVLEQVFRDFCIGK